MKLNQPAWPRFLPSDLVVNIARLGPVGRMRHGPGTWGSLAGLLYFTVFFWPLGIFGNLVFSGIGFYLSVAFCGEAEFRLGQRDPGSVVLDEFVAMPLCFLGWQIWGGVIPLWILFPAGFVLFRIFDIAKPFGIRKLQDLPDGWGVTVDDTAAALASCVTLHLAAWAWMRFGAGA